MSVVQNAFVYDLVFNKQETLFLKQKCLKFFKFHYQIPTFHY